MPLLYFALILSKLVSSLSVFVRCKGQWRTQMDSPGRDIGIGWRNRSTVSDCRISPLMEEAVLNPFMHSIGQKLKSHIEDLEKRAASAGNVSKANTHTLMSDDMNNFFPVSAQLGRQGNTPNFYQTNSVSMMASQACEPSAFPATSSGSSGAGNSPDSFRKAGASSRHGSFTTTSRDVQPVPQTSISVASDESDFLKAFAIPEDHRWSTQKGILFHEVLNMDIQDNIEAMDSLRFNTRSASLDTSNMPGVSMPMKQGSSGSTSSPPNSCSSPEQGSLESRIDHILRSIQSMGFESPDSFISTYYTGVFKERSTVKLAQGSSRTKGLPQVLEELQTKVSSWSMWESSGYRDTTVRSAAILIADEFDRLTKKKYSCEIELQHGLWRAGQTSGAVDEGLPTQQLQAVAAELRKTLRDELPNLHALAATFSAQDSSILQSTRLQLLLATIRMITSSGNEPIQEAANWVENRANCRFISSSSDSATEEFETSSMNNV
ncbi:hypothetical protein BX600DRAFT_443485 [Xylariales sp. PMI_506]|nr:hypothetical protein BX600DRAFT_443485 [Xylariales sp. PMI_506]